MDQGLLLADLPRQLNLQNIRHLSPRVLNGVQGRLGALVRRPSVGEGRLEYLGKCLQMVQVAIPLGRQRTAPAVHLLNLNSGMRISIITRISAGFYLYAVAKARGAA